MKHPDVRPLNVRTCWPRRSAICWAKPPVRDATYGTRVTYSPKVFIPLTMLCRDKCGYCTFAKAPARIEAPYLTPDAGAGHRPRRRARRLPRGVVHARRATRAALPRRGAVARRSRLRLDGRLPGGDGASWCSTRPGLLPHANAGALVRRRARAAAAVVAVAGHDDRVAQRRSRLPPRFARQDARAPPRHARARPASCAIPFTTGILVGIGESRPIASPRSRPSPRRTAATVTCRR